jgi:hypothetical protein
MNTGSSSKKEKDKDKGSNVGKDDDKKGEN